MAKVETLTAYKCTFEYLLRNNPLKEELKEITSKGIPPQYTIENFIDDFCKYTDSLVIGEITERAILLPYENVFLRTSTDQVKKWRIVPYAGKQGKPFHIVKQNTGKKYDFGSDSAALYEHNIFIYESDYSIIVVFHRQSGSGCKSVFMEVANKMLHEKGMKIDMQLYMPLIDKDDENIEPSKIQLQYVRELNSSDIAENLRKNKRVEVIRELVLNLNSPENNVIKKIVQELRFEKVTKEIAFAQIKQYCPDSGDYNDAEITLRIGKRHHKISWGDFDSLLGNHDITETLHKEYTATGDFINALSKLSDEYYNEIIQEENIDG